MSFSFNVHSVAGVRNMYYLALSYRLSFIIFFYADFGLIDSCSCLFIVLFFVLANFCLASLSRHPVIYLNLYGRILRYAVPGEFLVFLQPSTIYYFSFPEFNVAYYKFILYLI